MPLYFSENLANAKRVAINRKGNLRRSALNIMTIHLVND